MEPELLKKAEFSEESLETLDDQVDTWDTLLDDTVFNDPDNMDTL